MRILSTLLLLVGACQPHPVSRPQITMQPMATAPAPVGGEVQAAPASGAAQVPTGPAGTSALDFHATQANFESATITPGFLPDPHTLDGRSGGTIDVSTVSSGCSGWVTERPDHVVELRESFGFLRFYVASAEDTTLVVQTPSGALLCNDDAYGRQPAVEAAEWVPGTYRVWVGSYEQGVYDYKLHLTEVSSNAPSAPVANGIASGGAPITPTTTTATTSAPTGGAFLTCDVFNGQVGHCGSWYHGEAVVLHDGAYRACTIFNGQISHCGSWFQGEAPVYQDGAYRTCTIFNGQISHCGSWYRGSAVVYR
jgi:hypothetical protein